MRVRSLSVAILIGMLLVPVTSTAASALDTGLSVSSASAGTFKSAAYKRAKRADHLSAPKVSAPLVAAPTVTYADRVLALTNRERTSRGLRSLAFSGCADSYANSWAKSLSQSGTLSHQPLSPILSACAARSVGENVAYGNVTPEELVKMWMDSPGHRANILTAGFTHLGVGDVTVASGRVYAVQVFLTK